NALEHRTGNLPSPAGRSTRMPASLVGRVLPALLGPWPVRGLPRRARSVYLTGALVGRAARAQTWARPPPRKRTLGRLPIALVEPWVCRRERESTPHNGRRPGLAARGVSSVRVVGAVRPYLAHCS